MVPVSGEDPHNEPAFIKLVQGELADTRTNSMFPVSVPAVTLTAKLVPVATKVYQTSGWLFPDWQPRVPTQLSPAPTVVPG